MRRYLGQLSISLRATSVALVDTTLRQLASLLVTDHLEVRAVADINRTHIEAFKAWLAARPGYRHQATLSKTTLDSFACTSTTKRALASSCSSRTFSSLSRAISASRWSARGRRRGAARPASVPASRDRRK